MENQDKHYLFYITQNYSFGILRPLQSVITQRGGKVAWFADPNTVNIDWFTKDELLLTSVAEVKSFNPRAVFVPGNVVPDFFPGIKVEVFHGFEWKKPGHFTIRGFFDLYCTPGAFPTKVFSELAEKHKHFVVKETGWPKVDPLFEMNKTFTKKAGKPVILFAPTFSPKLTSAPALYEHIKVLSQNDDYQWIIRFHPKMPSKWVEKYRSLENSNLELDTCDSALPSLCKADVMISDTSSIITEFSLLRKPVITLNNSKPEPCLINITSAEELKPAIEAALAPSQELLQEIDKQVANVHPYKDGLSSVRVLEAVEDFLSNPPKLKPKPLNLIRKIKIRKRMKYYRMR